MIKITKSDMAILERIYLYGRGYATEKLLTPYFNYSNRYIQLKLNELRNKKLLKIFKNKQCFIYVMTAAAIDLFERDDYLVRMKKRNEKKELVQDKLNMLNFIGQYRKKGFKFINSFDKVNLFKKIYGLTDDDFSDLRVFGSDRIFFNDIMMIPEGAGPEGLHLVLLPRDNIYPQTYLKLHLIKQYLKINYIMTKHNQPPKIIIATNSLVRAQIFQQQVNTGTVSVELNPKEYSADIVKFYDANHILDKFDIDIKRFNIETTCVPYPHTKIH